MVNVLFVLRIPTKYDVYVTPIVNNLLPASYICDLYFCNLSRR